MIQVKNLGEYYVQLKKLGTASVANKLDYFTVPTSGYIAAITAAYGVNGTDGTGSPTQDIQIDVKKNGTSVFVSAATSILWAHAGQLGTANTPSVATSVGALATNPTPVAKGDLIQIDALQILNGTSPTQPTDLCVTIVLTRGYGSPPSGLLQNKFGGQD